MPDASIESLPLGEQRTRVVFVGAGFSRSAGLPIMKDFRAETDRELAALRRKISSQPDRSTISCARFIEAGDAFVAVVDHLATRPRPGDLNPENVEHVFCWIEALKQLGVKNIDLAIGRVSLSYLDRCIKLWLWKIFQKLPIVDDASRRAPYEAFLGLFSSAEVRQSTTFITTNYDMLLDWQLWRLGTTTIPAWRKHVQNIWLGELGLYSGGNAAPLLCKLHGSVNCLSSSEPTDQNIYLAAGRGNDKTRIGESGPLSKDQLVILAEWSLTALERETGMQLTPAVVPPVFHKNTSSTWIRASWTWAFEALQRANHICFVGYGLPASDGPVRALLQTAVTQRTSKTSPLVTVVDPFDDTLDKFCTFFGANTNRVKSSFEAVDSKTWRNSLGISE